MKLNSLALVLAFAGAPLAPIFAQTAAPKAPPKTPAPKIEVAREGELRLDGKLTAILGADIWQIEAFSFSSPRGVTQDFAESKTKTVQIAPNALVHPRGEDSTVALKEVKLGARIAVIGKNGADGTLQAREIVLLEGYGKTKTVGSVQINPFSSALIGKARAAFEGGDVNKAILLTNQSLQAAENANDRPGQAFSLNDLGLIFVQTQQFPRAKESYEKALAIWKGVGDNTSTAIALSGLAGSYMGMGDFKNALPIAQQALPLSENTPVLKESVLDKLGSIYYALKMRDQALETAELLVPLAQSLRDWETATETSLTIAQITATTDAPRARKALEKGDELAKNLTDEKTKALLDVSAARALWALGDADAARTRLDKATNTLQNLGATTAITQINALRAQWDKPATPAENAPPAENLPAVDDNGPDDAPAAQ